MLRRRRCGSWGWLAPAAGSVGMLLAAVTGLEALAPHFGLKAIALALDRQGGEPILVVYDGPSRQASSLCFYARVPMRWLDEPTTEFAVRSRGIGRDRFVTDAEVVDRWRARERVYLVTEDARLATWRARLERVDIIARSGTRVLLTLPTGIDDHAGPAQLLWDGPHRPAR